MNPLRAASFVSTATAPLIPVAHWPALPPTIVVDRVVGVAVNSQGQVYVAHRGDHPLLHFNSEGELLGEIGADVMKKSTAHDLRGAVPIPIATRAWLHGLSVDADDNLWVTDVGRHLVFKFDRTGHLALQLGVDGVSGDDSLHFAQPTHVAVNARGDFFVSDGYGNSRIVQFDAQGHYVKEWGVRGTGPGEFHTPHVVVIARDQRLYVADRENDRVQIFDQAGLFQGEWTGLHSVDGLCAMDDGTFFATAGMDHALLKLDANGRVLAVWDAPGKLCYPHAIAQGPNEVLYVADTGDVWVVTGNLPGQQLLLPRVGAEGSAIMKFVPPFPPD